MVDNNVDKSESGDQVNTVVEKESLGEYIRECEDKFQQKAELRAQNERPDYTRAEEDLQGLDFGAKKSCAFVKKLRNMTEGQKESLIKDMLSLNLSKYISEVAGALVEAKLKMSDIPMAIKICSLLHQRYSDFSSQLLDSWNKSLPKKPSDLANLNLSKMRIDIRFFAELITCGIFTLKEGLPILGNLLTLLVTSDKENHNNINIILTFCRHCGDDYAGLTPRKMRILSDKYGISLVKSDFLASDRQRGLRNLLKDYYKSLASHIVRDHKSLQSLERQNRRTLISKGELSEKRKEKFEQAQIAFQKLWSATQQMADILDEDLPELPLDAPDCLDDEQFVVEDHNIKNTAIDCDISSEYECDSLWSKVDSIITRSVKKLLPNSFFQEITKIVPWTNDVETKSLPSSQYTLAQVAEHCTVYDCWIVLFDKVYDVTDFMYEHPGGDYIIAENAGRDATNAFSNSRHSKDAYDLMEKYCIGSLVPADCLYSLDYYQKL
ncbi:regulator of nonsense transcripts 2 [Tetranychus urticae]|uniref:Cytochrome b5 heme-binding domain-containing protein n=1 Tax=Tetranychus urticae TaxID=32264 RepID=T1K5D0_TETUR|nr:regulator of nonsense transcripts 2 [Tetranychus urticae]